MRIPAIKDSSNQLITDPTDKANVFNHYYASVFTNARLCMPMENSLSNSPFRINVKTIRKNIATIGRNKSIGPDGVPGEILNLGGEIIVRYITRLFEMSINNGTLPDDWKKAIVVPILKGGNRSDVENYRPISLTSVVGKQMEKIIAEYMRAVWENSGWLYAGQHGFRQGHSCESQLLTVCQDISESLDAGETIDAVVIDFTKAFDLVPCERLLNKLRNTGIDTRVITWIESFLRGRSQRVKIDDYLSDEIQVTSGVAQGSVLGPLLFLAYVNDISDSINSTIRLFADDCILYRRIHDARDRQILQKDLDKIMKWAEENEMKINPKKCKAVTFSRKRDKISLKYTLADQLVPEVSSFKYLGVIIRSDLNWSDHINHVARKAWKSLHFVMRILRKGNANTKRLAYTSLVRPVMEYSSACWDPYRAGQINLLDRIQNRAIKLVGKNIDQTQMWEPLGKRRKIARLVNLLKAYTGCKALNDIRTRIGHPQYFGRGDHPYKIKYRNQKTDVGKYSFANRTITDWNNLPAAVLATFPSSVRCFRKRLENCV